MRLHSTVDLTGSLIVIDNDKSILDGTWTEDLSIFSPDALTSAPPRQA